MFIAILIAVLSPLSHADKVMNGVGVLDRCVNTYRNDPPKRCNLPMYERRVDSIQIIIDKAGQDTSTQGDEDLQSIRVIYKFSDGEYLDEATLASTGRRGKATPAGAFGVGKRVKWTKAYCSKKYDNARMENAIFFNGGIAIHATDPNNHFGYKASSGCVRVPKYFSEQLYCAVAFKDNYTRTRVTVKEGARRLASGQQQSGDPIGQLIQGTAGLY